MVVVSPVRGSDQGSWRLRLTGEVTSWTRCLSAGALTSHSLCQRTGLDIPIYSRMVPSSCSLTMWASSTLSYKVLGFLSAAGMMANGMRETGRRTKQHNKLARVGQMRRKRLRIEQVVRERCRVSVLPLLFLLIPGVAMSLEGPLRSRLVSKLWAAADWLPRQIGWISLPTPVPLSCLGGAYPRSFLYAVT